MKKWTLVIILLTIIIFTFAGYYLIARFGNATMLPKMFTATQPPVQSTLCQKNQIAQSVSVQGAAGSIYATLTMTNTGKKACTILLGNTITAQFDAKNIAIRYLEKVPSVNFSLAPSATVYSQIHYPNGPQCQSGIMQQPVAFLYKNDQTAITFTTNAKTQKLMVQACRSEAEKTIIDIWPLSKQLITQ